MNSLYRVLQVSKQGVHQRLNLALTRREEEGHLLPIIRQIREDHPRMSSRQIYKLIQPKTMGRDRFEVLCYENGFKLEVKRSFIRTTNSLGVTRFENHLAGLELTRVNQAWVSDITYFRIHEKVYYLTFIMDLYSRHIVGYSSSENLLTVDTTIPALQMAFKVRNGISLKGLIMHSDGGGQYYSKKFLALTGEDITNSMAENVYENPHAERINGTIKNDYLFHYNPQSFVQLQTMLTKAIAMYNNNRPHQSLNGMAPIPFEKAAPTLSTKIIVVDKRKKVAKKENVIIITNFVNH